MFSIEVPARAHEDVDEDHIVTRLRKVSLREISPHGLTDASLHSSTRLVVPAMMVCRHEDLPSESTAAPS